MQSLWPCTIQLCVLRRDTINEVEKTTNGRQDLIQAFGALSRFPPFSLSDLLCAIDEGGFRTYAWDLDLGGCLFLGVQDLCLKFGFGWVLFSRGIGLMLGIWIWVSAFFLGFRTYPLELDLGGCHFSTFRCCLVFMLDVIKPSKGPTRVYVGPCRQAGYPSVLHNWEGNIMQNLCGSGVYYLIDQQWGKRKIVRRKRLQSPKSFFGFHPIIHHEEHGYEHEQACVLHNKSAAIYGLLFYQYTCGILIVMFFCDLCSRAFICLVLLLVDGVAILFNIQGFSSNLWDKLLGYVTQQSSFMICTICWKLVTTPNESQKFIY